MNQGLKFVVLTLSFIAWLFFLIGCISYSEDNETVKNTAWFVYSQGGDTAWYALRKVTVRTEGVEASRIYENCSGSVCNQCDVDGKTAFGLLIVALLASTVSTLLSLAMINAPFPKDIAISNAVFSFIAFVTSLIAIAVFMGECYTKAANEVSEDSITWGPGSILSIIGMFFMVGSLVALVIAFASDTGSSNTNTNINRV